MKDDVTLVKRAQMMKDHKMLSLLVKHESTNLLAFATLAGDTEATTAWLKKEGVPKNPHCISTLHCPGKENTTLLMEAIRHFRFKTAKILIENGADVNEQYESINGSSDPLFAFILLKHNGYVPNWFLKFLLENADLKLLEIDPFKVFYNTCRLKYSEEVQAVFLRKGFYSLQLRNSAGYTVRDRILKDTYHLSEEERRDALWRVDRHVFNMAKNGSIEDFVRLAQSGYEYILVFNKKRRSILSVAKKEKQNDIVQFLEMLPDYQVTSRMTIASV